MQNCDIQSTCNSIKAAVNKPSCTKLTFRFITGNFTVCVSLLLTLIVGLSWCSWRFHPLHLLRTISQGRGMDCFAVGLRAFEAYSTEARRKSCVGSGLWLETEFPTQKQQSHITRLTQLSCFKDQGKTYMQFHRLVSHQTSVRYLCRVLHEGAWQYYSIFNLI